MLAGIAEARLGDVAQEGEGITARKSRGDIAHGERATGVIKPPCVAPPVAIGVGSGSLTGKTSAPMVAVVAFGTVMFRQRFGKYLVVGAHPSGIAASDVHHGGFQPEVGWVEESL